MKLVWHDHPDEAVRQKCIYLEKVRKQDGQAAYWNLTRELLLKDPWFLFRVALEWAFLDEKLVGQEFIKHVSENWGEDLGMLFPRGHGKTLPTSGLVISAIINDPNIAILEVSRTEGNAAKIGSFIADQLMFNDYLQQCFGRKHNEKGFLPSSLPECNMWGKDGYTLPYRKPRIDPTLLCIPLKGAMAGKHPDIIWVDDPTEEANNDEAGWSQVEAVIDHAKFLLPAHGFMLWTGTRWHDSDPLGRAVAGKLWGKQGRFKFIQRSCYVDDDPNKAPTFPKKIRWNMKHPSGYSHEMLEQMRKPKEEGGLGEFFDAQMRNDPSPADRSVIDHKAINTYAEDMRPKNLGPILVVGVETTGGGLPIYNGLLEKVQTLGLSIPFEAITNPKKQGVEKSDRIVTALQPIINQGRLYVRDWMLGSDSDTDTLGYELRRIRVAAHDDIADALHNVPVHLAKNIIPLKPEDEVHVYMSVDLAWSEAKRSDWTVAMIVAVDHRANYWVLDYERFKSASPEAIHNRLIGYYQKWAAGDAHQTKRQSKRKYPGAWR